MRCVPTGRVGLNADISGFVVAEDLSVEARLKRRLDVLCAAARAEWAEFSAIFKSSPGNSSPGEQPVQEQSACEQPPETLEDFIAAMEREEAQAGPELAAGKPRPDIKRILAEMSLNLRRSTRMHLAALVIRGAQVSTFARERLQMGERMRDFGALLWYAVRRAGALAWLAPRGLKIAAAAALTLYLMPWPDMQAARESAEVTAAALAPPAQAREPVDGWRAIASPIPAYYLEAPELDRIAPRYRARRQNNGARQDIMAFGDMNAMSGAAGKPRPAGVVSVEVYPAGQPEGDSLFVDVARRAALFGASVDKIADSFDLATKFGVFSVSDTMLTTDTGTRGCLAFRHVAEGMPLQIHGWFCGAQGRPLDRTTLSCILDRVDLLSAGEDSSLKAYFAEVERARKPCGGYKPAGVKMTWLDPAGKMPELKSTLPEKARRRSETRAN